ncbi:MAG: dockerin type I domain-containing protein [Pirellulales bacterium]
MQRSLRLIESLAPRITCDASQVALELAYEINRFRYEPEAYRLEAGWSTSFSSTLSLPPLAFNGLLQQSAQNHANEMSLANYLAHQSIIDGRWPNQMARDAGYALASELPSTANSIEAIAGGLALSDVDHVMKELGQSLQRDLLLATQRPGSDFREIGAGYGTRAASDLDHYWSVQMGYQQFGSTFLTGIVYDDRNENGRYDATEGLPGIRIDVGPWQTVTGQGGEWSLRVSGGRHTVQASGNGLGTPLSTTVNVRTQNVEVDFVAQRFPTINFHRRSPWTNEDHVEDVNADGAITPLDALLIINELNRDGIRTLDTAPQNPYLDANGDAMLTPIDVLLVINTLNRRTRV